MVIGQLLILQSIKNHTCCAQRPHEGNVTLETARNDIFFMRHILDRSTVRPHRDISTGVLLILLALLTSARTRVTP